MKKLFFLTCLVIHLTTHAQVKIGDNPTSINGGSLLELESSQTSPNGKGFVPPRVSLTALNSTSPLPSSPALITGTLVFNTNAAVGTGIGLYWWNATTLLWVPAGTGAVSTAWSLTGNTAINPSTNFLGTTDAQPLILKTGGTERLRILSGGNVGIGTTTPPNALSIIAANPLYLSGLTALTNLAGSDSILTISAGVVKKAPSALFSGGGGSGWLTNGNDNVTTSSFLGSRSGTFVPLNFQVQGLPAGYLGLGGSSYAISFGVGASLSSTNFQAIAIGAGAQAVGGNAAIAIGLNASAPNQNAIVLGTATTSADEAIAIGVGASSAAYRGIALGSAAKTSGSTQNIAIGYNANASSFNGIAIGSGSLATTNNNTIALGVNAQATGFISMAFGNDAQATGQNSTAFGASSRAKVAGANAFGNSAVASGVNSTVLGNGSVSSGNASLAVGDNTEAAGPAAIAIGNNAKANAQGNIVIGVLSQITNVSATNSLIFGSNSTASANDVTIIGNGITGAGQTNTLILGSAAKKIGIGTLTPANKVAIVASTTTEDPIFISKVQTLTTPVSTDSVLAIRGGLIKQVRIADLPVSGGGSGWSLTGNLGTSGITGTNWVGTNDDKGLVFKINNTVAGMLGTVNDGQRRTSYGFGSNAGSQDATAIGPAATASANGAVALGLNAQATVQNAVALGPGAIANQSGAIAVGAGAQAIKQDALAYGNIAVANGTNSGVLGNNSSVTADNSFALGNGVNVSGINSVAIGSGMTVSQPNVFVIGNPASAVNVGFGTVTPGNRVTIVGTNLTANPLFISKLQATSTLASDSVLTILNGVVKAAPFSSFTSGGNWSLAGNNGTNPASNFIGTIDAQPLVFRTLNTEKMRILTSGNVGIGIATPGNKLSLAGTNTTDDPLFISKVQTLTTPLATDSVLAIRGGVVKQIRIADIPPSANTSWLITGNSGLNSSTNFLGTASGSAVDLAIRTNGIERMRILGAVSGSSQPGWTSMGGGVSVPRSPVDMVGAFADKNVLTIQNSANNGYSSIDILDNAGAQVSTFGFGNSTIGNTVIRNKAYFFIYDKDFLIGTSANNAGVFNILNNGNIGINTQAPTEKLDVAGNIRFSNALMPNNNAGSTGQVLTSNGANNAPTWQSLGGGSGWSLTGNAGINPTNNYIGTTDGQPLAFRTQSTERMRIDASGNVGVGTNAPNQKLHVDGNFHITNGGFFLNYSVGQGNQVLATNGSSTTPGVYWRSVAGLGDFSAVTPLTYDSTTGVFGISQATALTDGYISLTDWNLFNNKISTLTLNTPGIIFNSPINFSVSNGVATGDLSLVNQNANTVFAGPAGGAPGVPVFRALEAADIPSGSGNYIQNQTTQQAAADFNISGSGTIGTDLSVNGTYKLGASGTVTKTSASFVIPVNITIGTGIGQAQSVVFTMPSALSSTKASVASSPAFDLPNGVLVQYARVSSTTEITLRILNVSGSSQTLTGDFYVTVTEF